MKASDDGARSIYSVLIRELVNAGRVEEAYECAGLAVKHGVWAHPQQRPRHFVRALPPRPTYEPQQFPEVRYLEAHYPAIRAEVDRVIDPRACGFTSVDSAVVAGRWDQIIFYDGGYRYAHAAASFPQTAAVIDGLPEGARFAGWAMLSWLHPGAHVLPHTGYSNGRLRIHLGIRTPPGAQMRVGSETLHWTEGRCLVFDDSFEHEVWHAGTEPRVVLLVDILHPGLPDSDRQPLLAARQTSTTEVLRRVMAGKGLRRVERAPGGNTSVELDEATEATVGSLMQDAHIRAFDLGREGEDMRVEFDVQPHGPGRSVT
jgi:aspartate beta-hydroxylase